MRRGQHAADDGSFGKSAGNAVGRGVVLLAVALGIGLLLLNSVEAEPPGAGVTAGGSRATTTTVAEAEGEGEGEAPTTLPPVRQPAEVKVIVANGSTVNGAAAAVSEKLKPAGYNLLAGVNATVKVQSPVVYFAAGFDREAAGVASALGLDPAAITKPMPAEPPVADLQSANVLVVVDDSLGNAAKAG